MLGVILKILLMHFMTWKCVLRERKTSLNTFLSLLPITEVVIVMQWNACGLVETMSLGPGWWLKQLHFRIFWILVKEPCPFVFFIVDFFIICIMYIQSYILDEQCELGSYRFRLLWGKSTLERKSRTAFKNVQVRLELEIKIHFFLFS